MTTNYESGFWTPDDSEWDAPGEPLPATCQLCGQPCRPEENGLHDACVAAEAAACARESELAA